MENDIKIIEFFGMPGVGKSTYCNNNFISKKDFLLIDNYDYLNEKKILRYTNYLNVLFNKKYLKLNYYFLKLILINKSSNKIQDFKEIFSYLKILSIYDIFIKKDINNKTLVLDQGFIQLLFSSLNNTLIFEKNNNKHINKIKKTIENFIKNLDNLGIKIKFIYLYTDNIENIIHRLNSRKINYSRFDKIKNNKTEIEKKILLGNNIFKLINKIIKDFNFNNIISKEILN